MQRVSKKSFIFSTLIMPILMVVLMCAPILIQQATSPETITIGVADTSGKIFPRLNSGESVRFVQLNGTPSADSPIDNDSIDGYLVITSDIITKESAERVDLILNATSNIQFEKELAEQINDAIETERLLEYNINDLSAILDNVKSDASVNIMRFDRDDHGSMPTEISAVIGIVMSMLLYFFLLLWSFYFLNIIFNNKFNLNNPRSQNTKKTSLIIRL